MGELSCNVMGNVSAMLSQVNAIFADKQQQLIKVEPWHFRTDAKVYSYYLCQHSPINQTFAALYKQLYLSLDATG